MAAQANTARIAPKRSAQSQPVASPIHFRVQTDNLNAHLFEVTLHIAQPAAVQRVSLPVWIPGSYLVREFSKHLQALTASQSSSDIQRKAVVARSPAALHQVDKSTWDIRCNPAMPLTLRYQVYALDNSVRTAWLDSARGFFNGTSLFLRVHGQTHLPHAVQIDPPHSAKHWHLVTGLVPSKIDKRGFGSYLAAHYDELADCPVEMGNFWRGDFKAHGVKHTFVVAGAPASFDGARLLADTQKICEAEIAFWHGAPTVTKGKAAAANGPQHQNYVFMLNAVDDGYGGLEHRNSTALICTRKDLPRLGGGAFSPALAKDADAASTKQPEGYTTLLGLISHEYFHTWNVKRLRPAELAQYDYAQENYTQLLWFFEGFTSYFDDLLLRRAGLIDAAAYLKLLNKTINQVLQTPGRLVQSVAQASFDAWVKYYRQDENTPNATVSYYTKGSLVALCLDLTLRAEGKTTLDAVMRALWLRSQGGPMTESDLADELARLGGRSFAPELAQWVHSTAELPVLALLQQHGVAAAHDSSQIAQVLGLRVAETQGIHIKTVLRGGAAEAAGFQSGDEWLAVQADSDEDADASTLPTWRIHRLDELLLYVGQATQLTAWVARDKKIVPLALKLPSGQTTVRLTLQDAKRVSAWLS